MCYYQHEHSGAGQVPPPPRLLYSTKTKPLLVLTLSAAIQEEYSAVYPLEIQKQLVDSNIASAYCTNK